MYICIVSNKFDLKQTISVLHNTNRQKKKQTETLTDMQIVRQKDRHANRKAERQTETLTDRQTDRKTDK